MEEHVLWYETAAANWTEALPLGNGRMGAMIWGNPLSEKIEINHETLWSGYPRNYFNYNAFEYLQKVRELIRQEREVEAQKLMEEHMSGRFNESFLPMASIEIESDTLEHYQFFRRKLDMSRAVTEAVGEFLGGSINTQCFLSAPDNILVYRMKGNIPRVTISLSSQLMNQVELVEGNIYLHGEAPSHVVPHYRESQNAIIYGDKTEEKGMSFGVLLSVSATDGMKTYQGNQIIIEKASEINIYMAAGTSFCNYKIHPARKEDTVYSSLYERLTQAEVKGYEAIYREHIEEYTPYYSRTVLELLEDGNAEQPTDIRIKNIKMGRKDIGVAALAFHYGRYLLLACSRKCSEPANLQGIWNKELRPYWSCNYTVNINLEMNYWPAEVCNLPECIEPLVKMIQELSEDGEQTAMIHYHCSGWTAHHNIDLWRKAIPAGDEVPVYGMGTSLFWPMAAGWLCRHLWEHYLYSQDEAFLKLTVEPLLRGAARFYLDWMVIGKDNAYTTCPSSSPENSFYTLTGESCSITEGAAMDLEIITDTFQIYLKVCKLLSISNDTSQTILERMPQISPIGIDNEGKIQEWSKGYQTIEPGHRHHSPMYGVYPGNIITDEKSIEPYRKFLDWKIKNHSSDFGWGLAWTMCLYARMRDADKMERLIWKYLQGSVYPNLFTLHPPLSEQETEVFQIDAALGYTASIAEMLLQSHADKIEILPALPKSWKNGRVFGLKARGAFTVDIIWKNGELVRVSVHSSRKSHVMIKYNETERMLQFEKKEKMVLNKELLTF